VQYRISIYGYPWGGSLDRLGPETTTVDWPLIDGVNVYRDVVDLVARDKGDDSHGARCRVVSVVEGLAVIEALEAAGAVPTTGQLPGTALALGYRVNVRQIAINLEPILPFEGANCGPEPTF